MGVFGRVDAIEQHPAMEELARYTPKMQMSGTGMINLGGVRSPSLADTLCAHRASVLRFRKRNVIARIALRLFMRRVAPIFSAVS